MRFLVIGRDGTDEGALERRMAARPAHLANVQAAMEMGTVVIAGGILNDEGKPAGSYLVMEFETRDLLDEYLANEPYIAQGVWVDYTVESAALVIKDNEFVGA